MSKNTHPEMNERIVGILRLADSPAAPYAAARIEELEAERGTLRKVYEAILEGIVAGEERIGSGRELQLRAALGKPGEEEIT